MAAGFRVFHEFSEFSLMALLPSEGFHWFNATYQLTACRHNRGRNNEWKQAAKTI
jgi:hypothetical protein